MNVIALQLFLSFGLVALALVLFAYSTKQRDYEHESRLAILPLEEESQVTPPPLDTQTKEP